MGFDFSTAVYKVPEDLEEEIAIAYGITPNAKKASFIGSQVNWARGIPKTKPAKNSLEQTFSRKFMNSREWKKLRTEFMAESEKVCVRCGATEELQADHIKPKSKYPELALDKTNLQVLCWECNKKKSTKED